MTEHGSKPGEGPGADYAAAAARFLELLRGLAPSPGGKAPDWTQLAAPLATQFQEWLRASPAMAPWPGMAGGAHSFGSGGGAFGMHPGCLLYTSPSPRDCS